MKDLWIKALYSIGLTLLICGLALVPSQARADIRPVPVEFCVNSSCGSCGIPFLLIDPVTGNFYDECQNFNGSPATCSTTGPACSGCGGCDVFKSIAPNGQPNVWCACQNGI